VVEEGAGVGWSSSGARVGMARSELTPPSNGAAAALPTLVCVRPARAHTPASRHVWGVHAPGARGAWSAPSPWPPGARRARPEGVQASRLAPPPPPLPPPAPAPAPAPVAASVAEIAAAGLVLAASASDGPGARRASPPPVGSGTPQQGAGGVLRCTGGGCGAQGDHGHGAPPRTRASHLQRSAQCRHPLAQVVDFARARASRGCLRR